MAKLESKRVISLLRLKSFLAFLALAPSLAFAVSRFPDGIVTSDMFAQTNFQLGVSSNSSSTGSAQDVTLTAPITLLTNASLTSVRNFVGQSGASIAIIKNGKASGNITITNNAGGTAANRIITGTGADLDIAPSATILLAYDTVNSRWQIIGGSGGGTPSLTANRAVVTDGAGSLSAATTTATEIGYVNGVTSAIQTQLNAKASLASPTFTGTVTTPALNVSGLAATTVPYLDASKNLTSSAVTPTELGYLSGVTSAIQTQLGAKASTTLNNLGTTSINAALLPSAAATRDLGSASLYWNSINGATYDGYGDTSYVKFHSATDTTATGSLGIDHNSTSLLLATAESSTNSGYSLGLSTANIAGANANATGGISITTGSKTAGTGNSGDVTITTGTTVGGNRGRITLADGSESNSPGAVWTISGSSGAGHWVDPSDSKNYIANPDAVIQSASTTPAGWANYADAAGVLPVDCTGGSPVTALTRNTTTPIGNTADFRWTKSAANRQGEGFSYDFTIQKTDQAKVMSIGFDYQVASGTFVAGTNTTDSDVEVYVYDVTNGTLIQPTTYKLFSSTTSPPAPFIANFQTASNSTSYRLCVHTATTSASAYTLALRNFEAKRSKYTYGTPITDWVSYTPTGSWVSNSTYTGMWRRVGSDIEVQAKVATSGAPTAASLTVSLPTGVTVDTARMISGALQAQIVGQGQAIDNGVQSYPVAVQYNNTTSVIVFAVNAAGTYTSVGTAVSSTVPYTFGAGDFAEVNFTEPVAGWYSGVQMSDSAPQSDVALVVTGTTQALTSTVANITWTTTVKDTLAGFNGTTYTAKTPGFYQFNIDIKSNTMTQSQGNTIRIFYSVNGGADVEVAGDTADTSTISAVKYVAGSGLVYLNSGDTFVARASSTVSVSLLSGLFSLVKPGGNQTIGATELIAARYTNTAGTSIPGSATTAVPFATKDYDTHGAFSGTTFTVPAAGKYRAACATVVTAGSYAVGATWYDGIYLNGTLHGAGQFNVTGSSFGSTNAGASVVDVVNAIAGDIISCRETQSAGVTGSPVLNSTAGFNHFEIERIGL